MKWALIVDAVVREITDVDPAGRFHPSLTWVACSNSVLPGDTYADGNFSAPVLVGPSPVEVRAAYEASAQSLLDSTAHAWGYDSIISAASYASSSVAQYKADAQALIGWRDQLWQAAYNVDVSVKNGTAMPATAADFLAMLPPAPARPTV